MSIIKHGLFEDIIEHHKLRENLKEDYIRKLDKNKECLLISYDSHKGLNIEEHFHDWLEFILVIFGEKRVFIDNKEYILNSGDFIMVGYNKIHYAITTQNATEITMQFKRGFIEKYVSGFDSEKILCSSSRIMNSYDYYLYKDMIELYCFMANSFQRNSPEITPDFLGFFYLFIYRLMEECQIKEDAVNNDKYEYNYIHNIISYINRHYNEDISLKLLGDTFHLAPEYISKIIKDELGKGFKEYQIQLRLDHAEVLIKNTKKTMLEISEECGFPNNKSFIKFFKKKYNKTPTQYRKDFIK